MSFWIQSSWRRNRNQQVRYSLIVYSLFEGTHNQKNTDKVFIDILLIIFSDT